MPTTTQANQAAPMALPLPFALILLLSITFQASFELAQSASLELELLLSTDQSPEPLQRSDFPKDFIFGASTSSYQVEGAATEGGRGISSWDNWAHAGHTVDGTTGDITADQYHRYEEDTELLAELNMDAYRFSISWSRIFPDGYGPDPNEHGIAYYNRLIDCLLSKGIQPYVTLFHFDIPQTLDDTFGGWMNRQIVDHFAILAEACFAAFGDRVKNWITVNEPGLYSFFAFSEGKQPPGRTSSPEKDPYTVGHNFILAHGAAVDIYKKRFQAEQGGVIGITLECQFGAPLTNSSEDRDAAQRRNEFQLGWFLDPIFFGDYPAAMQRNVGSRLPKFSSDEIALIKGSVDFIGINHYSSRWITAGPGPLANVSHNMQFDQYATIIVEHNDIVIGPRAASDWLYIVPWGIYGTLKWTWERYNAPIYITENGMDDPGDLPLEVNLRDTLRVNFYQDYLSATLQAIREGVDVRTYFAWSLLDNFEWTSGFTKRFGLVYVDYDDGQKRYLKDSAIWFKQFLRNHRLTDL